MPFPTPMARGPVAPYPNLGQTPRPVTLVDRLRQNGRTDRDDSPLRKLCRSPPSEELRPRTIIRIAIPTSSRISIASDQSRRYTSRRVSAAKSNQKSEPRSRVISDFQWICPTCSKEVLT
jgi:hypothetical protein